MYLGLIGWRALSILAFVGRTIKKSNKFENLTSGKGLSLSLQSSMTYKTAREEEEQNQASLLIPFA